MIKYLLLLSIPLLLSADKEPVRNGQDFALFIAIDDYDQWTDLRNPVSDATAIAHELEQHYGFATEILTNPSRTEIYEVLESYRLRTYGELDQLFIFFSGHGDFNEGTAEGFFVPKEGLLNDPFQDSYIPHTRLERIVGNIPCNHVLLAIDACFSGTFDESIALQRGRPGVPPAGGAVDERQWFINRQLAHVSRLYLTSGGKERTPDGDRYSPFTARFLEALRSYGIDDGILTFAELTGFMQRVEPLPRFGEFSGHEPGGDFLFVTGNTQTAPTNTVFEPTQSRPPNTGVVDAPPPMPNVTTGGANPSAQLDEFKETADAVGSFGQLVSTHSERTYRTLQLPGLKWIIDNLAEPVNGRTNAGLVIAPAYGNDEGNAEEYGFLYRYDYANSACGLLGEGWRLPTGEEWEMLLKFMVQNSSYSSYAEAGPLFMSNDAGSLQIRLGGKLEFGQNFSQLDRSGYYLANNADRAGNPYVFQFNSRGQVLFGTQSKGAAPGFSCRCVKED